MGATGRRTIAVKTNSFRKERTAAAALSPGNLLTYDSNGKVKKHASAGGPAGAIFAIENDVEGQGVSDAYASADRVQYHSFNKGDEVLALIANGEAIAIGDLLVSDGSGSLKERTADSTGAVEEDVIAIALETCDMSTSSSADADGYCLVEIL
jgi:hypothetical protein